MNRPRRLPPLILGSLALLAGCVPARAGAAPRAFVVDDAGDTLRLDAAPRRIVSLNPTATELVYAVGAGARVVGRTRWCDFPPAARRVPSVGEGLPPNLEAVLARRPDLVVLYAAAANRGVTARLRTLGIGVLTLRTDRLEDLARGARLLGAATGARRAGDSVAAGIERALDDARRAASRGASAVPAVILASTAPPIAIGRGSYLHELLELAGAHNIFGDEAGASLPVSLEAIAARKPAVVVTVGAGAGGLDAPPWSLLAAVRARRTLDLTEPEFARPTPRALTALPALEARLVLTETRR